MIYPFVSRPPATEQPILWLGLAGFDVQQRIAIEAALQRSAGAVRWRLCEFGDADAWWVNGAQACLMADGNLNVTSLLASEPDLKLNLSEVDRPVAFARPLASPEFEPLCTFDPASRQEVDDTLHQFEQWLRNTRAQFILGGQMIRRGADVRHGVYHVSFRGNLLAVLDFRKGRASLSPQIDPADLLQAEWLPRPVSAGEEPPSFQSYSTAQMAWACVRRSEQDLLPAPYRTQTIYFRRSPRVPARYLRDSQLMLLRELSLAPGTLEALSLRTGLSRNRVAHDMSCLFYASAITTTRAKAAGPVVPADSQAPYSMTSVLSELGPASEIDLDLTAPALRPPRHRGAASAQPMAQLSPASFDVRFR